MPGTRKLGRTSDHRKAMLRAMVTFLLENGRIETTVTRAKEVRSMAEKMITIAKTNDLHSKRQVLPTLLRKMLLRSCLTRLHLSMQTLTVVIPESLRSVPVVAMLLRWQLSSSFDLIKSIKVRPVWGGLFL